MLTRREDKIEELKTFYCIIAEAKHEEPLIIESYLTSEEETYKRYERFKDSEHIIRVAIGKVEFEYGNKTLFR